MTKKEREVLQQRQMEEAERAEQRREGSHSPYDLHHMPKHPEGPWRDPSSMGHGYPPPPPGPVPHRGNHGPMRGYHPYYRGEGHQYTHVQ